MIIGYIVAEIKLFDVNSLKDKRSLVKRFLNQISKKFNVSVCELEKMDSKDYMVIGISAISNETRHVDEVITEVTKYIEFEAPGLVTDISTGVL